MYILYKVLYINKLNILLSCLSPPFDSVQNPKTKCNLQLCNFHRATVKKQTFALLYQEKFVYLHREYYVTS